MFWFFTNLWATEPSLGVFPVSVIAISDEERAQINRELYTISTKLYAGKMDILAPSTVISRLEQSSVPEECEDGDCIYLKARLLGAERVLITTMHREREQVFLRVALHDVVQKAILQTKRFLVPPKESPSKHIASIMQALVEEEILSTRKTSSLLNNIEDSDAALISSVIEVQEGNITAVLIAGGEVTLRENKQNLLPFLMMKTEVTQDLYESVMGKKPSQFLRCGSDCPVERVSWYDAIQFSNALNKKQALLECYEISTEGIVWKEGCTGWRLPTEMEWYYAASGGMDVPFAFGGSDAVDENAWYQGNAQSQSHRSCQKKHNPFGLCDMSGNVWEWVWDADTEGESMTNQLRVLMGGSWGNRAEQNRISSRLAYRPTSRNYAIGFRLVRNR